MLRIPERLAGEPITFYCVQSTMDLQKVKKFVLSRQWLAIDTESTGLNCYRPQWRLRTVQFGDKNTSIVVPAKYKKFIAWLMRQQVNWIGHNGPHDIRCIDVHLGYETRVICKGETFIPSHHMDSRNQAEGGVGHGLKELAIAYIDRDAGRWEEALKAEFKRILIPIAGEVYKSGPRKGQQKYRKAKLAEGWGLIDPMHPAYIAYAAADPILTYRVWEYLQGTVGEFLGLYRFDKRVQDACDRLQRRAIRLDIAYTKRLCEAFTRRATQLQQGAAEFGCKNVHSGQQIANTLLGLGVVLRERTPTGQYKVDDSVLRGLLSTSDSQQVKDFIHCVLGAKQLLKRKATYAEAMLEEIDSDGRIHPSINSMGARTTRMSVSKPALQQLPTKDREEELKYGEDGDTNLRKRRY